MQSPIRLLASTVLASLLLCVAPAVRAEMEPDKLLAHVESLTPSLGTGGRVAMTLHGREQLILPDALEYLRGKGASIGPKGAANYAGAVRIAVEGAALADVFAGARTASLCPSGGQFGLFTPGIYSGEEAAGEAYLYGLRADETNRTNVAVVNTGGQAEGTVTLQLRAYDGDAGGETRGDPEQVTLEPGAWYQAAGFLGSRGVRNGWVRVERLSGAAPWVAYSVVNDGGSPGDRTGDGAYVPMAVSTAAPQADCCPIVYNQSDTTGKNVMLMMEDGSRKTVLLPGETVLSPSWSSDGEWIAFGRSDYGIWIVRRDGTGLTRLTGGKTGSAWTSSRTPGTTGSTFWLAFEPWDDVNIWAVEVELPREGDARLMPRDPVCLTCSFNANGTYRMSNGSWSNEGAYFSLYAVKDFVGSLWVYRVTFDPVSGAPSLSDPWKIEPPAGTSWWNVPRFAHRSRSLAATVTRTDPDKELWRVDLDPDRRDASYLPLEMHTGFHQVTGLKWSPDDQRLLCAGRLGATNDAPSGVFVIDLNPFKATLIAPDGTSPDWRP